MKVAKFSCVLGGLCAFHEKAGLCQALLFKKAVGFGKSTGPTNGRPQSPSNFMMCVFPSEKGLAFFCWIGVPWRERIETVQQVGILVLSGCPLRLALCSPLAPLPFALFLSP
jgi:hypothetical protein